MSRVLPILFNTDMVRAILDGRKTMTRRIVRYKYSNTEMKMRTDKYGTRLIEIQKDVEGETYGKNEDGSTWRKLLPYIEKNPPYRKDDILYVRETWAFQCCINCMNIYEDESCMIGKTSTIHEDKDAISEGCYIYHADHLHPEKVIWCPSIHMPKDAARIWLKVKDVKVERLQDMTLDDFLTEGVCLNPEAFNDPENAYGQAKHIFTETWNSTIKKTDQDLYGWDVNPWVWVIEFERCDKPEEEFIEDRIN